MSIGATIVARYTIYISKLTGDRGTVLAFGFELVTEQFEWIVQISFISSNFNHFNFARPVIAHNVLLFF